MNPNEFQANDAAPPEHPEESPNNAAAEEAETRIPTAGYCRVCGKPLIEDKIRRFAGVVYCEQHVPAPPPSGHPQPPPASEWASGPRTTGAGGSPGLAFILGLIPGVGAIYNGQYAKGLIHVVIFGLLVSIIGAGAAGMEPLFAMLLTAWVFYMAFEAFHTAKKRQAGEAVDEFSSILSTTGPASSKVGPIVLIAAGAFFLLLNLDIIELYQVIKFWPVLLIALGAWMLYARRPPGDGI